MKKRYIWLLSSFYGVAAVKQDQYLEHWFHFGRARFRIHRYVAAPYKGRPPEYMYCT
jgi:hypothetical protein